MLLNPNAEFALARRISSEGAPLGEVFSFLSGLYFRGKLAYAHAFGPAAGVTPGASIITTDRGLVPTDTIVTRDDLLAFACVDIAAGDERYTKPLRRDVDALARSLGPEGRVVLLGSIATGKYVDVLLESFRERLVFPSLFVGRGDMSRGGLLLRHAREGVALDYMPVDGAVRRGKRPPKLERIR